MPQPYLIGIAGPSGSGKTHLASSLARRLESLSAVVLSMDSYYRDLSNLDPRQRHHANFDSPGSIDWELFIEHLRALRREQSVRKPVYDFRTHTRAGESEPVAPGGLIIAEGILALSLEETRSLFDLRVFVEAEKELCLARRLARDVNERGRSAESVQAQWDESVWPMCERHVLPNRRFADVVVRGDQPVSVAVDAVLSACPPSWNRYGVQI